MSELPTKSLREWELANKRTDEEIPLAGLITDFIGYLAEDVIHEVVPSHADQQDLVGEFLLAVEQMLGLEEVKRANEMLDRFREFFAWTIEITNAATIKWELVLKRHLVGVKKEVPE